ncbi:ubiquitin-related domain-containing protein [Mucor mucedo]|uniref:ubiquitin-related domain-containing protein n=1 Tax=Mucor mucedo TaxID=29922 RepID=UPI00221E75E0|nr:ubiquitin-related domain-containing protein [Mucor mucedo]KAI7886365.1 ubiquitin-related domain-containing protein [Mucor mucedo]
MTDMWFKGPVAEAVQTVTTKNLVFLVFIYDDSEQSQQLYTTLANEHLVQLIKQKTVAFKMQKNSEEAAMFGQLYPISRVPVVYYLLQGILKEFSTENSTSDEIMQKINTLCPAQPVKQRAATDRKNQNQQLKKEKKADEDYKREIKQQIAMDRTASSSKKPNPSSSSQPSVQVIQHNQCNLNIKQLDGTSLKHSFASSDTLGHVSQWIDANRTDGDMPFQLFAQFPNRDFNIGDEQQRLIDLRLCPSATLIMKPIKNATSAYHRPKKSSGWLDSIYSAGDTVYQSVSAAAAYLVTPTHAPEPGQRLGGESREERQTYNGNSVNQEKKSRG